MSGGAAFLPSVKKRQPHDWLAEHHPPLDFNSSGAPSHHHVRQSVFVSPKKPDKPVQHPDVIETLVSDNFQVQQYQWQPPQTYTTPNIAPYQDYQYFSVTDDKFVLKKILRSLDKAFHFLKDNQEKSSWNTVIIALNANSKDKKYENYIFLYGILCFHCDDSKTIRAIVPTNCAFKFLVALHDDKHDLNKEQLVSFAQCYFSGVSSVCKKQNLLDIIYNDCLKCKAIKSGNYEEFMLEVKAKEFIEKCKEKEKARDVELLKFRRSPVRRVSPIRTDKSEKRPKSRSRHRHKSPSSRLRKRSRSKSSSNHSRSSRKRSRSKSPSNHSRSRKRSRSKSSRSRSSKHSPKHKKVSEDDIDGFIVLDECNDKLNITETEINDSLTPNDNLQKSAEIEGDKTKETTEKPGNLETKKVEQDTVLSTEDNQGEEEIVDMEGFIILDECDEKVNGPKPKDSGEIEIKTLDSGEEELKGVEGIPLMNDVGIQNVEPADSTETHFRILESDNLEVLESAKDVQRVEPVNADAVHDMEIADELPSNTEGSIADQVLESAMFSDVQRVEPVDAVHDMEVADELPSNTEGIADKLPVLDDQKEKVESTENSDITQDETCIDNKDAGDQPNTSQSHTGYQESLVDNEISLSIMKAYEYQNQEDMNREENFFDEIDRILVDFEKQNALDQKAEESEVQPLENVLQQSSDETFQHPDKLGSRQEKDTSADDPHDVGQVEDTSKDPFEGENSNSSHSNESEKLEKVDFKTRIKNEQISNGDLKTIVDRIKADDKTTKEKYVLKKGMLCEKTSAGEVRIVTHPEGIRSFCFIVHTMAGTHAPYNNALDIFHKHFMPYDGIEAVMEEVIATCEKCFKTV